MTPMTNPAPLTISATRSVKIQGAASVTWQVTASSSLVLTVTVSFDGGVNYVTWPVVNLKTNAIDTDGASMAQAANAVYGINTPGVTDVLFTVASGSGTIVVQLWGDLLTTALGLPVSMGSNSGGIVQIATNTTGGATPYFAIPAGSGDGDAAVIKASAGTVYGIQLGNIQSVPVYFKLYDKSGTPTSSDTPVKVIEVPANATAALGAGNNVPIPPQGIAFANGISWRIVTGIANNDSTEVLANNQVINVDYA